MPEKLRVHIFVSGKVQRVFFRQATKEKADEFSISGWVRNLPDDRVEAIFEGDKDGVEKMVEWARHGPRFANVENFLSGQEDYTGEFKTFEIR